MRRQLKFEIDFKPHNQKFLVEIEMRIIFVVFLLISIVKCLSISNGRIEMIQEFESRMVECKSNWKCKIKIRSKFSKEYRSLKFNIQLNILRRKFSECLNDSTFKICFKIFDQKKKNLKKKFNQKLTKICK